MDPKVSPLVGRRTSRSLNYTPLERIMVPRPADRFRYLQDAVAGQVVLDIGALDSTTYLAKSTTPFWLHRLLAKHAASVIGIDNSYLLPASPFITGANSSIVRGDAYQLDSILASSEPPTVLVAGELIEHLPDTLQFLKSIKGNIRLQGRRLVLTTPNATAIHNVLIGFVSRESANSDHLSVYTYKTLNTLCLRAGFQSWEIVPYYARFDEMKLRVGTSRRILVGAVELLLCRFQWMFPLFAGGWIVDIRI